MSESNVTEEVVMATTMSPICCNATFPLFYVFVTVIGIYFQIATIIVLIKESYYRNNISYRLLCVIGFENLCHMLVFMTLIPYGFTCKRQREVYIAVTGIIGNFSFYINGPLEVLLAINRYTEICIPQFRSGFKIRSFYNILMAIIIVFIISATMWMFTGDGCNMYYFCYRHSVYKDCYKIDYVHARNYIIYTCLVVELVIYLVIVGHIRTQRTLYGQELKLMGPERRLLVMSIVHFVVTLWRQAVQHVNNAFFVYSPFSQVSSITVVALSDVVNSILPLFFNKPLLNDIRRLCFSGDLRLFTARSSVLSTGSVRTQSIGA
ncbi:unnamed protein product [Bursaphelenchus okinawaensis]|uniref:G_PROTEIN_RECEP_F1_2 domain-containing protein n=1 Tax=Bursaphelenchus okinawaensis TaxID=465554 RepID=A0A811KIC8_9BILA|nr:unnamed protein product [Bursaphelenchus okinawaensis]CAG9105216.1 unnamed protein product [Bursaphelenchus okinawaensis]